MADELGDVDIEDTGDPDDEGWETEDEMEAEAEVDDSELTFSKHTGRDPPPPSPTPQAPPPGLIPFIPFLSLYIVDYLFGLQARCSALVWTPQQTAWR